VEINGIESLRFSYSRKKWLSNRFDVVIFGTIYQNSAHCHKGEDPNIYVYTRTYGGNGLLEKVRHGVAQSKGANCKLELEISGKSRKSLF
jgi:hypothetical protein